MQQAKAKAKAFNVLQSNQIVKRRKLWKRRRKLRSKLLRRRKMGKRAVERKEIELKGGKHSRTGCFSIISDKETILTYFYIEPQTILKSATQI